jgi:diguanylate cyclase (GGDEF)-like protein/PAS domain S-box-containing protein
MARVQSAGQRHGLLRVLALSALAAAVPISGVFVFPEQMRDYEALTWLLLLVPAFLWAYERGWRGVATALASGMAALSVTYAVSQSLGGTLPPLLLPVIVAYVAITLAVGMFGERLTRAQYDRAAETLALQDPLTGLANRRRAELHLDLQFATAERGYPLAVVLFDIDNMHAYNHRNGRSAGDGVLKGFASLLRQQTRRMDVAARFGPDEFLVVLGGATEEGAVIFAARVQEHLRAAEQTVALPTVSAGIAAYRPDVDAPDELIRAAEQAMHLAKADGRDRVRIHGRRLQELTEPDPAGVEEATARSAEPMRRAADEPLGRGRFALVLTRDAIARARLAQLLRAHEFDVAQAGEAKDLAASLQHVYDLVFVDIVQESGAVGELVRELRFRSPATRVIGITPPDTCAVTPGMLKVRVDGHYMVADEESLLLLQVSELLHERDALAETQLRHHQLSGELRSRDRELRLALAASESRYRALVQAVSDVVLTTDIEGRWTSLNPAWTAATGLGVDESVGRPLYEFLHADDRDVVRARFEQIMAGVPCVQQEARLRTAEGGHRSVDLRLEVSRTADGEIDGAVGIIVVHAEEGRIAGFAG